MPETETVDQAHAAVLETKGISVVTADIKATKAPDGSYDITLSIPNEDRDGEIIDAKALQYQSPGRMPIDVDHGMTVLTTVGSGVPVYEGDSLKLGDFRFASTQLAQDVKTLVDEQHISKMSVAFMAAQREKADDGKVHIRSAELLNAAIVAIPSLREAEIVLAAKSALAAKVGARNSSKDAADIQSIHDAATELGATCAGVAKATTDADQKTAACPTCGHVPADTDPEEPAAEAAADEAAADAAVTPPAEVLLAQAQASIASAELTLLP